MRRLLNLLVFGLATLPLRAEVAISKCVIVERDRGIEMTSGFAQNGLEVDFRAEASCDCEGHDVVYRWDFCDGNTATDTSVSHAFKDGGSYSVQVTVTCNDGCGSATAQVVVHVIEGIEFKQVGQDNKLCFNSINEVKVQVLPDSLPSEANELIDIYLVIGTDSSGTLYKIVKPNAGPEVKMDIEARRWPKNNNDWGPGTLYAFIDPYESFVPGQDDIDLVTGRISFLRKDQAVTKFFETTGTQNPGRSVPNGYYYWKETSAYHGTVGYDGTSTTSGGYTQRTYPYNSFVTSDCWQPYTTPVIGSNARTEMSDILSFAWTCRHEWQHHLNKVEWWGAGGEVPALDLTDRDGIPTRREGPRGLGAADGGPFDPDLMDSHPNDGFSAGWVDQKRCTLFRQPVMS
jgi:PKD repeat protein